MRFLLIVSILFYLVGCDTESNNSVTTSSESTEESTMKNNPFAEESILEYATPDFSKVENKHFMPAFKEGMKQQNEIIEQIVGTKESPSFENTILALETSGVLLNRVSSVFFSLGSANTNDEIQTIEEDLSPKLAAQRDGIYLNKQLFERIESLYLQKKSLDLDKESEALLENYYDDFVKAGAKLSDEDKDELKVINSDLASLSTEFGQKLLEASKDAAIYVSDVEELDGLSESQLESLKEDGQYKITITNTTQQPILQSLNNRALREAIFKASLTRADKGKNSTLAIISEMAELRAKKAKLIGFDNYAEWNLVGTMVKRPQVVKEMFAGLVPASITKAKVEAKDIQDMIKKTGGDFELEPWDWSYYAEKVRKERYDLDEEQIKPYFELKNVLENGVFYAAEKLYGITIKERTGEFPTYHPDMIVI